MFKGVVYHKRLGATLKHWLTPICWCFFSLFSAFFPFVIEKDGKTSLNYKNYEFGPVNGVRSTCSLVEIHPTTYHYNHSCFVQVSVPLNAGCARRLLQTSPTFELTSRPTPTTNHFHVKNVENLLHSNLTFANMKKHLANNEQHQGSISSTVFCTTPIIHALHQSFTPEKASQKLGIGREQFSIGPKPIYEVHSNWSWQLCIFIQIAPRPSFFTQKSFRKFCFMHWSILWNWPL